MELREALDAVDENEKLKEALDTLSKRHAEVLFELDQIMERRAALVRVHEELRVKYQDLVRKHVKGGS